MLFTNVGSGYYNANMESAPFAPDEAARQRALEELQILDTPAEQEFDDITLLGED